MEIRPILASLRQHRIPAVLIVLEIALACAVLCNAVFMIGQRLDEINLPNAIDETGIADINVHGIDPKLANADIPRNLAALQGIPGIIAVTSMNTLPLTNNGWNTSVSSTPDAMVPGGHYPNVAQYFLTAGGENALGLKLLSGRFFTPDEFADSKLDDSYMPTGNSLIVTRTLADRLWPGQPALGRLAYVDQHHYTVVGVVADVLRPNKQGDGKGSFYYCGFFPISPHGEINNYVVRSAPQDLDRVIREATQKMEALSPDAVITSSTFSSIRDKYFDDTRSMIGMLVLVCAVMLAVTSFGIVGLTSFWVGQRRRQIGIRRAVGATQAQIMRYFQTENFLLSTAGVVFGMLLAFGINLYLMQHYQMNRMPWYYLPASALALWLLGQLAVFGPARRASRVPPVVATRSV
ncbi:MAG TPA: FtsX-like permease family protein [Rudaea sp.]|nr:FtsX-like permease family protein [Rudaea sp.]